LLHLAVQDRAVAQRETEQLRKELERVRRAAGAGGSSYRASKSSQSDLEDCLAAAVRRAEETQIELAERVDAATGERDRLHIRAEAAELLVAETTRELVTLRVQGSSVDQMEMVRLRTEVTAQQIRIDELRGLVMTLGQVARKGSGEVSRGLFEGKEIGAAGPQGSSDGSGGEDGPPELGVPTTESRCRETEGPSPKSPRMTMAVNGRRPQLKKKEEEDGDRRQNQGNVGTGISV
ncbi:hypothetical protein Taro_037010, partial [Colocasia esculenta]|nr:hypothetical protein [Colocasia esculenta]